LIMIFFFFFEKSEVERRGIEMKKMLNIGGML
jgi:hypothetical protein